MVHRPTFTSVHRAKAYLVNRITEQAIREGSPLSDAETKLLYYSEDERTVGKEVVADFPDDNSAYELKIRDLLKRRYIHECGLPEGGESKSFEEALDLLKSGDHYLLVMAEPALASFIPGVPRLTQVTWKQSVGILFGLAVVMSIAAWLIGRFLE